MTKLTVESVYIRHASKELTRQHFWKLLGMMAGMLLCIGVGIFAVHMASPPAEPMVIDEVFHRLVQAAVILVISTMWLGMTASVLELCRGNAALTGLPLFSRMNQCLKAFGLRLLTSLKLALWGLPGFAIVLYTALFYAAAIDSVTGEVRLTQGDEIAIVAIIMGGYILTIVPVLLAALRYMLSLHILADKPYTGVFACVRESKEIMKGHKWQCFKLLAPFFLLLYAIIQVAALVQGFVASLWQGNIAGDLLSIILWIAAAALALCVSLRIHVLLTLFYLTYRKPDPESQLHSAGSLLREPTAPETPATSTMDAPLDTPPETNENAKENNP